MKSIYGVKFNQVQLNNIKALHFESPEGLHLKASSLAAYILLHFKADTLGRIREDELILKNLAVQYNFVYGTIHKGFHELFDCGLLQYIDVYGTRYIQISGYDEANQEGNLNYFILPKYILDSQVLVEFVRARDASGIIGLLELINGISREGTRKNKTTFLAKCKTLLRKMKKTTRNILDWIKRIGSLIKIESQKGKYRKEKEWTFTFVEDCYIERIKDPKKTRLEAMVRKEVQQALSRLPNSLSSKDISDSYQATIQDCLQPFYPIVNAENGEKTLKIMLLETVAHSIQKIASSNIVIQNFGGLWRKVGRECILNFVTSDSLTPQMWVDLSIAVQREKHRLPAFLPKTILPFA